MQSEKAATRYHFSPQRHQSRAPFSHFVQPGITGYAAGSVGQDPQTGALVSDGVAEQCAAGVAGPVFGSQKFGIVVQTIQPLADLLVRVLQIVQLA